MNCLHEIDTLFLTSKVKALPLLFCVVSQIQIQTCQTKLLRLYVVNQEWVWQLTSIIASFWQYLSYE